jgi:hypothetical protein
MEFVMYEVWQFSKYTDNIVWQQATHMNWHVLYIYI